MEGDTLTADSSNDGANAFKDLAGRLTKYNIADLLSTVGGLQLIPQNASRVTRLEALAHSVGSLHFNSGPDISTAKLREICTHPSLQALAQYEDPAENQFAEEFTFFGGSYLVIPGIAQAGEFMLANLCKAMTMGSQRRRGRR